MAPTKSEFDVLLETAHALADASAPVLLKSFRRALKVDNKDVAGGFDPVTEADQAGERSMRAEIRARHPDHAIIGEEYDAHIGQSPYAWVLDPIDGTRAFIMGSPLWGTLIGLRHGDRPVLGVMNQPFTGERFWSEQDASYFRRDAGAEKQRIQTRPCASLAEAVLTSTHPDLFEGADRRDALARLKSVARLTRYGGDCYHYALLASGFIDVIVESGLQAYDIAALVPIIEQAGGIVTTWNGKPAQLGGDILAAGDRRVHAEAMAIIAAGG